MADESLAAFMDVTGCSYDDAFHRLASCGGHLGNAISRFFSIDAGPSGTRRSPSPTASDDDSESEDEEEVPAPAPVPAAHRRALGGAAQGRSPSGAPSAWVSRWDNEAARSGGVGGGSRSSRRRRRARRVKEARRVREAGGSHGHGPQNGRRHFREDDVPANVTNHESSRRRRQDMFASSSSDEEEAAARANNSSRRRLNPKDGGGASDGEEKVVELNNGIVHLNPFEAPTNGGGETKREHGNSVSHSRFSAIDISSGSDDDDMLVDASPPPSKKKKKSDKDALFRVPHGLTWKGGFHGAKVHAARRARWLLVNVQSLELPSLAQNRDVWASDLVAQCVRDHFVLWQADADGDDGGEEAVKVLCYYKVPRDRLPVVLVVDPVTGQAVDRLHGTDPNDFLVSMAPFTLMKPILPVIRAAATTAAAGALSNLKPAATAHAPASRHQEQAPAARKPAEPVAAAAAAVAPPTGQQPAPAAKVCKLRVRLPDGRVVEKEFGSQCAVAALFAYCRSELAAGAAAKRPFRLLRFAGASREEIGDKKASFESLRLNMSTVSVELG